MATTHQQYLIHRLQQMYRCKWISSVAGAKFVASFKDHMFYAGMSSNKQEMVFSVPFDEDDFSSGAGSGSIAVDDTITGLKVFRDNLFIFCEDRIFKLTGTSVSDFTVAPSQETLDV